MSAKPVLSKTTREFSYVGGANNGCAKDGCVKLVVKQHTFENLPIEASCARGLIELSKEYI